LTELPEDRVFARHARRVGAVLIIGAGAVGGFLAEELARMGFSPIQLVDRDVLEVENLIRHPLGAQALGQPKASALANKIWLDFPLCEVEGLDVDFLDLTETEQRRLVSAARVVVAATDNLDCQRRVNWVALAEETAAVYPAVWVDPRIRDAEVGEILWVLPGRHTPCYECAAATRLGAPDAEAARGARADIQLVSLAAALVVAALLDATHEQSAILDPDRNAIYLHGLTPTSPGIRPIFPTEGLQSRTVQVHFPPEPCPVCGGQDPITAAARTSHPPAVPRAVAEVAQPVQGTRRPSPELVRPPIPPAPDPTATSFRRLSVAALIAVIAIPVTWVYGASTYTGGRDVTGDLLRALLGLAVFIGGGIVLIMWLVSLPAARRALARESAARADYRVALLAFNEGPHWQDRDARAAASTRFPAWALLGAVVTVGAFLLLAVLLARFVTDAVNSATSQLNNHPAATTPYHSGPPLPGATGDVPPSTDPGQQPVPAGATILGSVNFERYCQNGWGMYAVLRFPNAWGWRCSSSPAQADGNRVGDQNISVTAACQEQYGSDADSRYRAYTDPDSWFCYRI
jgi:molybdopterin/thiamine biosynthesis adenylyltransferase